MATFRHKTINRYRLGDWQFDNFYLSIRSASEAEKFRNVLAKLPARISNQIVEINEDAMRNLERPAANRARVIRGAQEVRQVAAPSTSGARAGQEVTDVTERTEPEVPESDPIPVADPSPSGQESDSPTEPATDAADSDSPTGEDGGAQDSESPQTDPAPTTSSGKLPPILPSTKKK